MAKFKPVRSRKAKPAPVQGGLPCLVLILSGMVLVAILLFLVLKYANG
jgi:hypothetical protein